MLKFLGAVLVLFAGTMFGFFQALQYARRPRQIRELITALQRLETEIVYGYTPLPEAAKRHPGAGHLAASGARRLEALRHEGGGVGGVPRAREHARFIRPHRSGEASAFGDGPAAGGGGDGSRRAKAVRNDVAKPRRSRGSINRYFDVLSEVP
jgi:hypothetical protein